MTYSIKTVDSDNFEIISESGEAIKNHLDNVLNINSESAAKILAADLNDIATNVDEDDLELNQSFVYCILSTFSATNDPHHFDVSEMIHWDLAYRCSPGPPALLDQKSVIEKCRHLLKSNWVDLPLNYSRSIEEMKEEGVPLVPNEIIEELSEIEKDMSPEQRFTVDLLFRFYHGFSLTFVMLFITGKLSVELFLKAYAVFGEIGLDYLECILTTNRSRLKFLQDYLNMIKR